MITSTTNANVKYIRSLSADHQERDRERCFVLEGVRLVTEALQANIPLRKALYAPEQLATTAAGRHLLEQLMDRPALYPASPRVVAAAANTVTPQGIVAVVPYLELPPASGITLVLDGVQDPGNVGTLLRSAEAAGAGQAWCLQGTADAYSPKVVRAAMGAHFYLSLRVGLGWNELAGMIAKGTRVCAAVARADIAHYNVNWCEPAVVIIGSEAQGVSAEGLALATEQITIPMEGRSESLNAAVAGSVILFEALRQRQTNERLRAEQKNL